MCGGERASGVVVRRRGRWPWCAPAATGTRTLTMERVRPKRRFMMMICGGIMMIMTMTPRMAGQPRMLMRMAK